MTVIYAFTYTPEYEGLLKVGETARSVNERLKSNIIMPSEPDIVLSIECDDISDHDVHRELKKMGKSRVRGEWFKCTKEDVIQAILRAKGIRVQAEGDCKDEDLVKYVNENHHNLKYIEGVSEVRIILEHCKFMGITSIADFKAIIELWHKIKEEQSIRIIGAINNYGIDKLVKYYDIVFNKIEKVSNFDIKEIKANKNIIDSFTSLYNTCSEDTEKILEEIKTLKELLEENKIGPIFTKALLKNFKSICEEANKRGISEKEYIERIEKIVESFNKIMSELHCHNLEDLCSRMNKQWEYMTDREAIDASISKIQHLWNEWGVKNAHEFWDIAKKVDKEQKDSRNNFIKAVVGEGEGSDQSVIKELEERTFEFGKYKGKKIKQIIYEDNQYVNWLIDRYIQSIQIYTILLEQVRKERREKRQGEKEQKQLPKRSLEEVKASFKTMIFQ